MIQSADPDIILGTESWLNSNILDSEVFPGNFNVIRKDRPDGRASGGVFIASRNDLILTHRPDFDADCEVVWAQLQTRGAKPVFIGCYYRPPNDGALSLDELDLSISRVFKNNASPNIWLGGDFNLGDIDWNSLTVSVSMLPKVPYVNNY